MTPVQRQWWRIALELKLRKASGDSFQGFFSEVMHKAHGDDFVRVRPYGRLGDKGCDGYLKSTGHVYQCYGALNGDGSAVRVSYLIGKMDEDFHKADVGVGHLMKKWHMVHNLVDGLPTDAITKLDELVAANPKYGFAFAGLESLEATIFSLTPAKIEDLLGIAATSLESENLQLSELRTLVTNVAQAADDTSFDPASIRPVPPDKLDFNKLPNHWKSLIASGWQNTHLVIQYLQRHHDPLLGERVAQVLRGRYQYLKAQGLPPGAIMGSLYETVVGIGTVTAPRQVAAQAVLAFLFESCDIFEDDPAKIST